MKKNTLVLLVMALLCVAITFAAGKDVRSSISETVLISPRVTSSDATSAAIAVDDHKGTLLVAYTGIATYTDSVYINWQITECDTLAGTYTPVVAADVLGENVTVDASGTVLQFKTELTAADFSEVAYVGDKKYIKFTADLVGNHSAATPTIAAFAIEAYPYIEQ